jgi:hypothetical protein
MDERALVRPRHATGTPGTPSASDGGTVSAEADDALVTEAGAAAILDVPPRTLQWRRLAGKGPPFVRISSRVIRYRRSDLVQWINARLQPHRP